MIYLNDLISFNVYLFEDDRKFATMKEDIATPKNAFRSIEFLFCVDHQFILKMVIASQTLYPIVMLQP